MGIIGAITIGWLLVFGLLWSFHERGPATKQAADRSSASVPDQQHRP